MPHGVVSASLCGVLCILWAQCHSDRMNSRVCVLVVLFWKAVELLGGGTLLEEVSHKGRALSFDTQTPLPVLSLLLDF